jgi:exopolysaccharide biosynthesis polyprenyl glycosylphosphotransferase
MSSSEGLRRDGETAARTPIARPALARAPATARVADRLPIRQPGADRFWRDVRRRRMLALADVGAAAVASLLVTGSTTGAMWAVALLPGWVLIAKLFGLYDRDQRSIRHLTIDEMSVIAAWVAAGTAMLGLLLSLTPAGPVKLSVLVAAWLAVTVVAGMLRGTVRWLWRHTTPPELTAVLGEGELASAARRKLELFPDMHLRLVDSGGLPLNGMNADRAASLRELVLGLDRVIVAMEWIDPELIGQLAGICRDEQVKLSVVSPLRGRASASPHLSAVAELPVLEYDTRDPSRSTMLIKRVFDLFVSASTLVVLAPLFPLVALAIKLDSRGPVFFTQRRAGKGGVPFRMYKLRTMIAGAERALPDVVALEDLPEPMFKLRADPRVTRTGRLLRRFSLDELPQLVNVLRGDMSIVGPRPEQVELVERYLPEHRFRLDLSPGMTGPMQVYGRGDLDFSERLEVEFDYVENVSLARDVSILFQTIPVVLRGNGAY